jgi:hypothetical protein
MKGDRATWERLQAKWREADSALDECLYKLRYKYGSHSNATATERKRLEAIRAREDKAREAIFAWLDQFSPRQWRSGVAYWWPSKCLSYDDATTSGHLSTEPQMAYGSTQADLKALMAPVESREVAPSW